MIVAGRSVFMLVDNIDAFERREIRRDPDLIVGGSTARVIDAVDAAAHAEDHVLILGPEHIAHPLARRYIAKVGPHAWFRPGGDQHLDHFLSTRSRVRSVVIDLSRVPPEHDLRSLVNLLETDLRFVITYPDGGPPTYLPDVLRAAAVTVPRWRSDETVIEIADAAAARHPHGILTATSVAHLLHRAAVTSRDRWLRLLEVALRSWNGSEDPLPIDEIARNV